MKRREAIVYWRGYAAGAGDLMPNLEPARSPRVRGVASRKEKRIRKRKPEPLIIEEFLK